MVIDKDFRPVWWSLTWSCLFAFIPTIPLAIAASSARYEVTAGGFVARTGVMTKRTEVVELYRTR